MTYIVCQLVPHPTPHDKNCFGDGLPAGWGVGVLPLFYHTLGILKSCQISSLVTAKSA